MSKDYKYRIRPFGRENFKVQYRSWFSWYDETVGNARGNDYVREFTSIKSAKDWIDQDILHVRRVRLANKIPPRKDFKIRYP